MKARRILVITGSRAEFGLLRSTLDALAAHPGIERLLAVTGSHLIGRNPTIREVESKYFVDAVVEMHHESEQRTRSSYGLAFARGVEGITNVLTRLDPDVMLVLGDRIEVFAAASAAALLGVRVAHVHGGDVAVGVADDSIRHATTKLSHVHFAATRSSADRVLAMGESPESVFVVGSPAIDGLASIDPLDDVAWAAHGSPEILVQMHPTGESDDVEHDRARDLFESISDCGRVLLLAPNIDPGSDGIRSAIIGSGLPFIDHLPRSEFIGLLKRVGMLIGNSSAGLLECAAMGVRVLDIGDRQEGRERGLNVIHTDFVTGPEFEEALNEVRTSRKSCVDPRFGDGFTGPRIVDILATMNLERFSVRKRWHS